MNSEKKKAFFAPQLFIGGGVKDIDFYIKGLGAIELRRFLNDEDGSVHVAELSIGGALFHLHEERLEKGQFEPIKNKGVTCIVGVFVEDVDGLINQAISAGAELVSPAKDYEYGYRQGEIRDPFGHFWLIQKKI
jgi:PhnB protein